MKGSKPELSLTTMTKTPKFSPKRDKQPARDAKNGINQLLPVT
jgi:hypothetical protein